MKRLPQLSVVKKNGLDYKVYTSIISLESEWAGYDASGLPVSNSYDLIYPLFKPTIMNLF
jgi:hypothetical protein